MSRAYRIKVHANARRMLRASDHVRTQLELLAILPAQRMAAILADELLGRGFQKNGATLVRRDKGIVIEIDPATATVTVRADAEQAVKIEVEAHGWSAAADGAENERDRETLRQGMQRDLERQASTKSAELQKKVTARLEAHLANLSKELDQAVNRATGRALKEKAAQIGQIKNMTEDASGSLTIVLEV